MARKREPWELSPSQRSAQQTQPSPQLEAALEMIGRGLYILPLCWPNAAGVCGYGQGGHRNEKGAGKAPLTPRGVLDSSNDPRRAWEWWSKWPNANIGIDLKKSRLVCIAPDSPEWEAAFHEAGLPDTVTAQSGGGEGHFHYYYQRPDDCPTLRINKSAQYDIQSEGYMVAPPSLHLSGRHYTWLNEYPWFEAVTDLPLPPEWALDQIKQVWAERTTEPTPRIPTDARPLSPQALSPDLQDWWDGRAQVILPDGSVDRSGTLYRMGIMMARKGASVGEITASLRDRDEALGYRKYSRRRDGGSKQYTNIAYRATELARVSPARPPDPLPPPDVNPLEEEPLWGAPLGQKERPRGQERKQMVYAARRQLTAVAEREGVGAEFSASGLVGKQSILLVENPALYTPKRDLLRALGELGDDESGGKFLRLMWNMETCGRKGGWSCEVHGEKCRGTKSCRSPLHPNCMTDTSNKVAQTDLPDLGGAAGYREIWLTSGIVMRGEDWSQWADWIAYDIALWKKAVAKIAHRKRWKGKILHRAHAFHVGQETLSHWKIMVKEETVGEADSIVAELQEAMEAEAVHERRYYSGDVAVAQMIEDSMMALVGVEGAHPGYVWAFHQATRGKHSYESFAGVRKAMQELPKPEPLTCPECGLKLTFRLDPPTEAPPPAWERAPLPEAAGGLGKSAGGEPAKQLLLV